MSADDGAAPAVRPLTSPTDVMAATGAHPVAVLDLGDGDRPRGFVVGAGLDAGAVVVARESDHGVPGAALLGDAAAYAALLTDRRVRAWLERGAVRHLSAPRRQFDAVRSHVTFETGRGGDWDWMWTRRSPPTLATERGVHILEAPTRDELVAFLGVASPYTHGQPFARATQAWVGIRDPAGRLVACGGSEPSEAGTPTLAGIAVDPAHRGEGLGAHPPRGRRRRCVRAGGVRRQHDRPPSLPPPRLPDRDAVAQRVVRGSVDRSHLLTPQPSTLSCVAANFDGPATPA